MKTKLLGFPPSYFLSLSDAKDRQTIFFDQLKHYDISNSEMISGFDSRKLDLKNSSLVEGLFFNQMNSCDIAVSISHLNMIKTWYETSDSPHAIFFEDDVNLRNIDNWNFTWNDVMSILPEDWNCIQFCLTRWPAELERDPIQFKLHRRIPESSWSAAAYLINREYAKQLIDSFFVNGKWNLKIDADINVIPYVENVLFYTGYPRVYVIVLFHERLNSISSFYPEFSNDPIKEANLICPKLVSDWWKENGQTITINDLKL